MIVPSEYLDIGLREYNSFHLKDEILIIQQHRHKQLDYELKALNHRGRFLFKRDHLHKKEKELVLSAYNHRCIKCGTTDRLEIDHFLPYSVFKLSLLENNSVVLCKTCNIKKTNKYPSLFFTTKQLKQIEYINKTVLHEKSINKYQ